MPNNQKYWDKRAKNEREWIDKNVSNDEAFNKVLESHYDSANEGINQKISQEYMSLAKRDGVTLSDAMKAVRNEDVKAYQSQAKKIVDQAHELYKKQGSVTFADFPDEVNKRLRVYNATMRINRLELLKSQMGLEAVQAGLNVSSDMTDKLKQDYTDELQRQAGILGENFVTPSIKEISKIVGAQTAGANFSKRIWANTDVLKAKLDTALTQQMIQGLNPRDVARQLRPLVSDSFNNAKYAAERIARTESARVQTQAQLNSFKKYGYKYCKWIAEPSACRRCLAIANDNEGVYSTEDVPDLPAHANCRCSLSAWYKDDDTKIPDVEPEKEIVKASVDNGYSKFTTGKMTNEQKQAIQGYYHGAAYDVNSDLRYGMKVSDSPLAKELSSTIDDNTALKDFKVYRKVISGDVQMQKNAYLAENPNLAFPDLKVGDTFVEKGFMSTSKSTKADRFDIDSDQFEGDVELHINVPKGSKALDIQPIADEALTPGYKSEEEVLLQHGSKFKVIDVKEKKLEYPQSMGSDSYNSPIMVDKIKQVYLDLIP